MNISLENWLRNKLQENEEMHDYAVATETVRCWIDEYEQLSQHDVIKTVCEHEFITIRDGYEYRNIYKRCEKCGQTVL